MFAHRLITADRSVESNYASICIRNRLATHRASGRSHKITVTRRALVANDIPELAQNKITGLTTALAGKQDNITFETAYDASTNKAATMTDVDAAETAAKEYTDTALTWGSF